MDRTAAARFGQLLRAARQRRGVSAEHVAAETGIPIAHLAALEAGELQAIPGGMYRRAEARAYADAVGLDAAAVLSALQQALAAPAEGWTSEAVVDDAASPPVARPLPAREQAPRRPWGLVGALLVGGAMLLFEQTNRPPTLIGEWSGLTAETVPTATAVEDRQSELLIAPMDEPGRAAGAGSMAWSPALPPSASVSRGAPAVRGRSVEEATVLIVSTTPRGARVTVNGIGWGSTPVTIRHLPEGVQRVRVVKERFVSEERVVDLTNGQARRVAIPLRPSRPVRR